MIYVQKLQNQFYFDRLESLRDVAIVESAEITTNASFSLSFVSSTIFACMAEAGIFVGITFWPRF
jgi:hypothetical protein